MSASCVNALQSYFDKPCGTGHASVLDTSKGHVSGQDASFVQRCIRVALLGINIYTVLAKRLACEGIAVCHLHWRLPPTRPNAPRGTLKAPHTLLEGTCDIGDAAAFLRMRHGGDALPMVLVIHRLRHHRAALVSPSPTPL